MYVNLASHQVNVEKKTENWSPQMLGVLLRVGMYTDGTYLSSQNNLMYIISLLLYPGLSNTIVLNNMPIFVWKKLN